MAARIDSSECRTAAVLGAHRSSGGYLLLRIRDRRSLSANEAP